MFWTPSCSSTASSSPSSTVASGSWFTASRSNEPARRQKKLFTPDSAERARRCTRPSSTNSPDPPAMSPLVVPPRTPPPGTAMENRSFFPWKSLVLPQTVSRLGLPRCRDPRSPGGGGEAARGCPPGPAVPPFFLPYPPIKQH